MRVLDSPANFRHGVDDSARLASQLKLVLRQSSARGEFHTKERKTIFAFAYFVDWQNVWMIETGGSFGFATETHERVARVTVMTQDTFEGDYTTRMALPGPVDNAHPATTDLFKYLIIPDPPVDILDIDLVECVFQ
jgi:hypothetical protein